MAPPGGRSDQRPPDRSARLAFRRPTRKLFTSAAAKGSIVLTSRSATASTSPPMAAKPGPTLACATASRFRRWLLILATPTGSSSRLPGIPTARTPSAASTARPTVPRPSRRCSPRTKMWARPALPSIRPIPMWSMPHCGRRGKAPGKMPDGTAPTAASSNPPMAAKPGNSSPAACPMELSKPTSAWAIAIPNASSPRWRQKTPSTSTLPLMPVPRGTTPLLTRVRKAASAAAIYRFRCSIPRTLTSST